MMNPMDEDYDKDKNTNSATDHDTDADVDCQDSEQVVEEEGTAGAAQGKKLWNPLSFLVLGALFSFLPAALLYALNWGRLGQPKKRNISLVVAIGVFAAIITLVLFSRDGYIRYLSYGLNVALGFLMYKDQVDVYKVHRATGGGKASVLPAALLCVAAAVAITWVSYVGSVTPDGVVQIEGDELYYTSAVPLSDVEKLANYLVQKGFLLVKDDHSVSVKLDKEGATYVFSVVVLPQYIDNDQYMSDFKILGQQLSEKVFQSKVVVELCDDQFNPLKIIGD